MMTLEEYAAQQAQGVQQPQDAAEGNPLDLFAAQQATERLSFLLAEVRGIIEESGSPADMLTRITSALFGERSAEADAVAAAIEKDNSGVHELVLAEIRQRRKTLKQQAKQLNEMQKDLSRQLDQLNAAEREHVKRHSVDLALADTMTFCKSLNECTLREARELYARHKDKPAAMGLLYGSLVDLARSDYAAGNYVRRLDYLDLMAEILAAINLQNT